MAKIYKARLNGGSNLKALQYADNIQHTWHTSVGVIPTHYKPVGCHNNIIVWRDTVEKCYVFSELEQWQKDKITDVLLCGSGE